ncbi:MAG: hypothetical protein ACNI27_07410 [Desulfovibrio sp.]
MADKSLFNASMFGAGALMNAGGSFLSGQAQEESGEFSNKSAQAQATMLGLVGKQNVKSMRRRASKNQGAARMEALASGYALSGSLLDALADNATQLELEVANAKWQNEQETKATRARGEMAAWAGRKGATQNYLAGAGKLFSGGAQLLDFF